MKEMMIPAAWDRLDPISEAIDRGLAEQGVPTVLRMRTQLVLEEFFSAVIASPGADGAQIRCVFPAPWTVLLQCRSSRPEFAPDWTDLQALDSAACTYGLKLALSENACQIAVGRK